MSIKEGGVQIEREEKWRKNTDHTTPNETRKVEETISSEAKDHH